MRSRAPVVRHHQIASLDAGWRLSACLLPVGFAVFLALALASVCRSRVAPVPADESQPLARPGRSIPGVRDIAIGPGAGTLTLRLLGGRFVECNLDDRRLGRRIDLSQSIVADVLASALSADGTTLAAGDSQGSLVVRRSGRRFVVAVHQQPVVAVACTADGRHVASAARASLAFCAADTGQVIWSRQDVRSDVVRLVFSADGRRLAACHAHGLVEVWDVRVPAVEQTFRPMPGANLVSLSPDGGLVTGSHGGHLEFRDLDSGRGWTVLRPAAEPLDVATALAFSPDARLVACGRSGGTIELWDVAARARAGKLTGHDGMVCGLRFSTQGDRLLSTSIDSTLRVWDLESQTEADCIDLSQDFQAAMTAGGSR